VEAIIEQKLSPEGVGLRTGKSGAPVQNLEVEKRPGRKTGKEKRPYYNREEKELGMPKREQKPAADGALAGHEHSRNLQGKKKRSSSIENRCASKKRGSARGIHPWDEVTGAKKKKSTQKEIKKRASVSGGKIRVLANRSTLRSPCLKKKLRRPLKRGAEKRLCDARKLETRQGKGGVRCVAGAWGTAEGGSSDDGKKNLTEKGVLGGPAEGYAVKVPQSWACGEKKESLR